METIDKNSDELYKKKYLKYKNKYIETQQLYSEELDGGTWGDKTFVFCPSDVYDVIKEIYFDNKFKNKDFFLFSLGPKSFYTEYESKEACNCWGECKTNFWGNENVYPAVGLKKETIPKKKNIFSDEMIPVEIVTKNIDYAKELIIKKIQSDSNYSNYKHFYFKSTVFGYKIYFYPNENKSSTRNHSQEFQEENINVKDSRQRAIDPRSLEDIESQLSLRDILPRRISKKL